MRQHPIPQNILDVEFKLFTKFTVKEFAYVATGAVIGGLFVYLWTQNRMPGIIAFPSLIFFGGLGLILGMVPIHDQPADKIFSNYLRAINRPTLRVWQGEDMKLKMKKRKNAGQASVAEVQKAQAKQSNLVDSEEEENLKKIGKMMEEEGLGKREEAKETNGEGRKDMIFKKENIEQHTVSSSDSQLSGTINLVLANKQNQAIPNATVIVKDTLGKTKMASKSDNKGQVLSNQKLENAEYIVEINHEQYSFKPIKFIVEKPIYPIIKITSL